jgi:cytochrome c oxidase subunit 4
VDVHFSAGVLDVGQDSLGAENMEAFQQAIAERVAEQQRHHGMSQFFWVWGVLLVITGIEVYLTYQNLEPVRMLTILMGLSLVKAALIIGYFMHMKYEVSRMKWLTMCSLVACLALMMIFFPDAFRILSLGVK